MMASLGSHGSGFQSFPPFFAPHNSAPGAGNLSVSDLMRGNLTMRRYSLADGDSGIARTVAYMNGLAQGGEGVGHPTVRSTALDIVRKVPNRDGQGEIQAVFDFVKKKSPSAASTARPCRARWSRSNLEPATATITRCYWRRCCARSDTRSVSIPSPRWRTANSPTSFPKSLTATAGSGWRSIPRCGGVIPAGAHRRSRGSATGTDSGRRMIRAVLPS